MKFGVRMPDNRGLESPPSRGAWIEMSMMICTISNFVRSPPSRGAWIEM